MTTEVQNTPEPEIKIPEKLLACLLTRIEELKAENTTLKLALVPTLTREA